MQKITSRHPPQTDTHTQPLTHTQHLQSCNPSQTQERAQSKHTRTPFTHSQNKMHRPIPPTILANRPPGPKKNGRVTIIAPATSSDNPAYSSSTSPATGDDQIFDHNKLLQQSILECLDRETERFAEEILEKDLEIQEVHATKEDMAVYLSHTITENKRLNDQLQAARSSLENMQSNTKTLSEEKKISIKEIYSLNKKKELLENHAERLEKEVEENKEIVRGMQLATAAFHSDIKVRTLTQERLEQDNILLEDKLTNEIARHDSLKKEMQMNAIEKNNLNEESDSTGKLNQHLGIMLHSSEEEVRELRLRETSLELVNSKLREKERRFMEGVEIERERRGKLELSCEDLKKEKVKILKELERATHLKNQLDVQVSSKEGTNLRLVSELEEMTKRSHHLEHVLKKTGVDEDGNSKVSRGAGEREKGSGRREEKI